MCPQPDSAVTHWMPDIIKTSKVSPTPRHKPVISSLSLPLRPSSKSFETLSERCSVGGGADIPGLAYWFAFLFFSSGRDKVTPGQCYRFGRRSSGRVGLPPSQANRILNSSTMSLRPSKPQQSANPCVLPHDWSWPGVSIYFDSLAWMNQI
jgi:hypothetical protein